MKDLSAIGDGPVYGEIDLYATHYVHLNYTRACLLACLLAHVGVSPIPYIHCVLLRESKV